MEESRLGEGISKEEEFYVGHVEFEVSEVHPGRDIQMALKFRR